MLINFILHQRHVVKESSPEPVVKRDLKDLGIKNLKIRISKITLHNY